MRLLFALSLVAANFFFPFAAWAEANLKSPLQYSLREYGVILGIALLGGAAGWVQRVKKGEADASLPALVGELMISAFSGLIAFWVCESFEWSPLITAAVAGMAGHAGGTGIAWLEKLGRRYAENRFGLSPGSSSEDGR